MKQYFALAALVSISLAQLGPGECIQHNSRTCTCNSDCCDYDTAGYECKDGTCNKISYKLAPSQVAEVDTPCHWYGFACESSANCCQDQTAGASINFCLDGFCEPMNVRSHF